MGATFRAKNSGQIAASSTSVTVNAPAGVVEGDLLIVVLATSNASPGAISATGWTVVPGTSNPKGSGAHASAIFYKVAEAGEASSWSFSWTTGTSGTWISAAYYDASMFDGNGAENTGGPNTAHVAPSVSPNSTDGLLVCTFSGDNPGAGISGTYTPPASMTERADQAQNNGAYCSLADEVLTAAGATGTRTATSSENQEFACFSVVLAGAKSRPVRLARQAVNRAAVI